MNIFKRLRFASNEDSRYNLSNESEWKRKFHVKDFCFFVCLYNWLNIIQNKTIPLFRTLQLQISSKMSVKWNTERKQFIVLQRNKISADLFWLSLSKVSVNSDLEINIMIYFWGELKNCIFHIDFYVISSLQRLLNK